MASKYHLLLNLHKNIIYLSIIFCVQIDLNCNVVGLLHNLFGFSSFGTYWATLFNFRLLFCDSFWFLTSIRRAARSNLEPPFLVPSFIPFLFAERSETQT